MDTINKTGVPPKNPGDGLSAKEINAINDTVNRCVDASNSYLTDYCNINEERGNMTEEFPLYSAVKYVPLSRRKLGLVIRFFSTLGCWAEYVYVGLDTTDDNWNNEDNWSSGNLIDGGEW
jgi:hypothetical protein